MYISNILNVALVALISLPAGLATQGHVVVTNDCSHDICVTFLYDNGYLKGFHKFSPSESNKHDPYPILPASTTLVINPNCTNSNPKHEFGHNSIEFGYSNYEKQVYYGLNRPLRNGNPLAPHGFEVTVNDDSCRGFTCAGAAPCKAFQRKCTETADLGFFACKTGLT